MTSIDLEVMDKEFDPIEEEVHLHEIDDELQALIDHDYQIWNTIAPERWRDGKY